MDNSKHEVHGSRKRPAFPKRVVITGGMPYGNKDLHFGHIGGMFVHADVFARFMRDRIGKENVLFVSGTDCYGSPILEYYRQLVEKGEFKGDIQEFVQYNHRRQKEVLDAYYIDLNLFAASSFSRSHELHKEMSDYFFKTLYAHGHLERLTTRQFFDPEAGIFLNGRQVVGHCPIAGCQSERGYADECSLGHQYDPEDLINPRSTITGKTPEMRDVTNWYFKLPAFKGLLEDWLREFGQRPGTRPFVVTSISEFFEPPAVFVKKELMESLEKIKNELPLYTEKESKSQSACLVFGSLAEREKACAVLTTHGIRYRTGKTLVPFRLTGNIEWGMPVPELEGTKGLTFWVWPESLWAPLSFSATYLEKQGQSKDNWREWWCSPEAKIVQFIGEDNLYFYGPAEMAMFMGMQGKNPTASPQAGQLQLPDLVVNNHILFLDKKASSSGAIKPPMARDLLNYYTADQLRTHFLSLGLALRSVGFKPKPYNPAQDPRAADPVMKEGNLLCNVFNRAVRSCFYTLQKYYDGKLPAGEVSEEVLAEAEKTTLDYEESMYKYEFHSAIALLDNYIRGINKYWDKNIREAGEKDDDTLRRQTLIDTFHMVRVATVLLHPIAPQGTEKVREYLQVGEEFWNWKRIFEPLTAFIGNPADHQFKFLEPRVDFFEKHPSQAAAYEG